MEANPSPSPEQLARWMQATLKPEEEAAREAWLADSAENRAQWADFQNLWLAYGRLGNSLAGAAEPDLGAAWKRLSSALPARRPLLIPLGWAAAALLLALSALALGGGGGKSWHAERGTLEIWLPDSSQVTLRQGGHLRLLPSYGRGRRALRLEGEAFFEVRRDSSAPFLLAFGPGELEVLGTSFLVEAGSADTARISVFTGQVALRSPVGEALVGAGQASRCGPSGFAPRPFRPGRKGWMAGGLSYAGSPLGEVLEDLAHVYQIEIEWDESLPTHCPLSAQLAGQPPEEVLQNLSILYGFSISQTAPGHYLLQGGHCQPPQTL